MAPKKEGKERKMDYSREACLLAFLPSECSYTQKMYNSLDIKREPGPTFFSFSPTLVDLFTRDARDIRLQWQRKKMDFLCGEKNKWWIGIPPKISPSFPSSPSLNIFTSSIHFWDCNRKDLSSARTERNRGKANFVFFTVDRGRKGEGGVPFSWSMLQLFWLISFRIAPTSK